MKRKKKNILARFGEWNMCLNVMEKVLQDKKIAYTKNEMAKMYGPSIQVFYNNKLLAEFPMYIHRQDLGCYESMLAILIERYGGDFPTWMAPVQCIIIPEYDEYIDYSNEMKEKLRERRVRVETDFSDKTVAEKIKRAKKFKIPYIALIGKEEFNNNKVSVIRRGKEEIKEYTIEEVMERFDRRG